MKRLTRIFLIARLTIIASLTPMHGGAMIVNRPHVRIKVLSVFPATQACSWDSVRGTAWQERKACPEDIGQVLGRCMMSYPSVSQAECCRSVCQWVDACLMIGAPCTDVAQIS